MRRGFIHSVVLFSLAAAPLSAADPVLWYRHPASRWGDALPVGNGRLGGMVFGGIAKERVALNEDTIWNGKKRDRVNPEALKALPEVRRLLFEGKVKEAEALEDQKMMGIPNRQPPYQPLGDLNIEFTGIDNAQDYRRELNLATGVARVSYRVGDTACTREIFSSLPDQAIVVRLSCDKPGQLTFRATLTRSQDAQTTTAAPDRVILAGEESGAGQSAGPVREATLQDGHLSAYVRSVKRGLVPGLAGGALGVRGLLGPDHRLIVDGPQAVLVALFQAASRKSPLNSSRPSAWASTVAVMNANSASRRTTVNAVVGAPSPGSSVSTFVTQPDTAGSSLSTCTRCFLLRPNIWRPPSIPSGFTGSPVPPTPVHTGGRRHRPDSTRRGGDPDGPGSPPRDVSLPVPAVVDRVVLDLVGLAALGLGGLPLLGSALDGAASVRLLLPGAVLLHLLPAHLFTSSHLVSCLSRSPNQRPIATGPHRQSCGAPPGATPDRRRSRARDDRDG